MGQCEILDTASPPIKSEALLQEEAGVGWHGAALNYYSGS